MLCSHIYRYFKDSLGSTVFCTFNQTHCVHNIYYTCDCFHTYRNVLWPHSLLQRVVS